MFSLILDVTPPVYTHSDKTDIAPILFILGVLIAVIAIIGFICSVASTVAASKENNKSVPAEQNNADGSNGNAVAKKKGHPILIVFFIILAIVSAVLIIKAFSPNNGSSLSSSSSTSSSSSSTSSSSSSTPQLFSRSANNSDITFSDSQMNFSSLGQDFVFTSNTDIKNLILKFSFYDSSRSLITSKTKTIGNTTKGTQYSVSFSITDFSFLDNFKINSVSIAVTGGTVSYFK